MIRVLNYLGRFVELEESAEPRHVDCDGVAVDWLA